MWINVWPNYTPNGMKKYSNEWTKVKMHAQCFARLLKFDTTTWNSYHWRVYCASAKVDSYSTAVTWGQTFAINELDLQWHKILHWPNYWWECAIFFKPLLTWVMLKSWQFSNYTNLSQLAAQETYIKAQLYNLLVADYWYSTATLSYKSVLHFSEVCT